MIENGTWEQVNTKECPNDARIIKYEVDGQLRYDLTAVKKQLVSLTCIGISSSDGLKAIEYGQGTYNPKLWGELPRQAKEEVKPKSTFSFKIRGKNFPKIF